VTLKGITTLWKGSFNKGVDAPETGDNVRRPRRNGVTLKGITTLWKGSFNKGVDALETGDNVRRPPQPGAALKGTEAGYGRQVETRG